MFICNVLWDSKIKYLMLSEHLKSCLTRSGPIWSSYKYYYPYISLNSVKNKNQATVSCDLHYLVVPLSRWYKQTLLWPHRGLKACLKRIGSSRAKSISRCLHRYVCLFTEIQDNSKWLIKHLAFRTSSVNTLQETLYYSWQETVETGKKIVRIPLDVSELEFFTEQFLL